MRQKTPFFLSFLDEQPSIVSPRHVVIEQPSRAWAHALLVLCVVAWCASDSAQAVPQPAAPAQDRGFQETDLQRQPTWSIPTQLTVRQEVLAWLDRVQAAQKTAPSDRREQSITPEKFAEARAMWVKPPVSQNPVGTKPTLPASESDSNDRPEPLLAAEYTDLLDRVMTTSATVDARAATLKDAASAARLAGDQGDIAGTVLTQNGDWLNDPKTDSFQQSATKLWLARQFVRQDRFDEGLSLLVDLDLATSVDPAALLFLRAACQHWLLDADAAVESLGRLLERSGEIPVRYERLAHLLQADLTALQDESLDHIARRMRDITRRLDFGRAGPKTRTVQDGVIASLDKLIAAIEEQQNQQNQSGGSGSGSGSDKGGNGKPMDDSRIAGGKGPGEVTKREIGDTDGWGNLPPHKREEALQQIGREFPAHYREAIEQYFKRLASSEDTP
ncbi:MAG: hypothetical protein NTY87_01135 [Planctomycetia bacterium]|nr:hypothetical protein [Planctomycetia bacterium]